MDKRPRLLIIDDEDIVLKSCLRILKNEQYDIDTVFSAEEGLDKIKEKEYDVVITDLMMPGMGGMEFLRIVKKEKCDFIVVIFTGYATAETAREALKLGAFDYIPKPFTPEEFRDVIKNALKAHEDATNVQMLDLMTIVSHELKSPISVVHTTADTLYKGYFGKLDPKQQQILETIIRNCQYLEDIIRSYIDLSKMDMDQLESFKENIDLINDVVVPIIEIPEYKNNMKEMDISTRYDADAKVNGDPNLLKIVVTNLLNNAIKYGKEKTAIQIDVTEDEGKIVYSIYNEGVGISREDIEKKLFNKFSRLKQKGTEGVKGSGLGLYICKKIIEKHNGKIWVDSEQDSWVRFSFSLPKRKV